MSAATPPSLALPDSLQSALQWFYQSWGHQAVIAGGTVWFDGGSFSSISIPTAISPVIEDRQVRSLLNQTRKLAAIYRTHQPDGIPVALDTMRDKSYALGHLQRQFRQQVRSASTRLEVRECTWEEWKTAARRCDHETLSRRTPRLRGDHPLLTASRREQVVTAARAVPSLRLHACLWDEEIVAYLVHVTLGTICEGLMSHRCDDSHNSAARHAAHLLYY